MKWPFVRRTKYLEMVEQYNLCVRALRACIEKRDRFQKDAQEWRRIAFRFNAAYDALKAQQAPASQFTQAEIDQLIRLCHPDKHGGKESATAMTQKLMRLRK